MDFTIVPLVAKLATSSWRAAVAREHSRTILHLSHDDRLVAAVGGAVAHFAERVGMENAACNLLTAALEDLCRQTLPLLQGTEDGLDVAIEDFDDRLEIIVEHTQRAAAVGGRGVVHRGVRAAIQAAGERRASVADSGPD